MCVHSSGVVTYEEPTADERELAMGFPRGSTAAPAVSKHTRHELLGQAIDLNSIMWILAAARATGKRRLQLGGEAVRSRSERGGGGGARNGGCVSLPPQPVERRAKAGVAVPGAMGKGAGGARSGGCVSLPPQPVGRRPKAGVAVPGAIGQGAGGARSGGCVSLPPQPVGRRPKAGAAVPGAMGQGAGGARSGGCVSLLPQPVGRRVEAGAAGSGVTDTRPQGTGPARAAAALKGMGTRGQAQVARAGLRLSQGADCGDKGVPAQGTAAVAGGGVGVKVQPRDAVTVGGGSKDEGWKVGAQLTRDEGSYVAAVVERNRDVFALSLEEIGEFKLFEVELKLKSEQPIFERRRRHSIREWELVDERCREQEAAGIIEECDSDFAADSVMAAKKDPEGNWKLVRFCTNLRRVNEQTTQDRYPMPLPEEALEWLGHAKFYTTIDIRGAFHQLMVKQAARRSLAFWSSLKLYCWKRCSFGARNASAWFQRAIDWTLRGLEGFARSFVDNLLVAGEETIEEHMELVQRVFKRLKEVGLRCHPEKCCFAATEIGDVAAPRDGVSAGGQGCGYCGAALAYRRDVSPLLLRRGQLLQAVYP
jgi:hypothetical protein